MAEDITIQIIANSEPAQLDASKNIMRRFRGDIVKAHYSTEIATLGVDGKYRINAGGIGANAWYFIHMRDVPDDRAANIFDVLRENIRVSNDTGGFTTIRRRRYMFKYQDMPAAPRAEIVAKKEGTGDFDVIREYVKKKIATTTFDPNADDTSNPIEDSDLPG
jgi:hypothetical protein